ncbi:hypothetical protein GUJ93_ZPchr0013g34519 [Zizania palustris]|uniref:Bifunctional inhibitor/plant lipid transfer protein/seed storage helical domain-containing protein n=1 Tax=Zizania palustris TaxID=103762 RepID=A0A8J6C1B8_ZIZPA|nr:hypothetical protein GUJ93_ZPchr0013g34519 [Zizania palustris]
MATAFNSPAGLVLAAALLLLVTSAHGQSPATPPPAPTLPAPTPPAPSPAGQCPIDVSQLASCANLTPLDVILNRPRAARLCCPPIAQLSRAAAAQCLCAALEQNDDIFTTYLTNEILRLCDKPRRLFDPITVCA